MFVHLNSASFLGNDDNNDQLSNEFIRFLELLDFIVKIVFFFVFLFLKRGPKNDLMFFLYCVCCLMACGRKIFGLFCLYRDSRVLKSFVICGGSLITGTL